MAALSVNDRDVKDEVFLKFLPVIISKFTDGRNYVIKAVNWALRQIGKRNLSLNIRAIEAANEIKK